MQQTSDGHTASPTGCRHWGHSRLVRTIPSMDLNELPGNAELASAEHVESSASGEIHSHPLLDETVDEIARALCRKRQHQVILTGARGLGKRTAIREFARRMVRGQWPSLVRDRVTWMDCENVGPEESRRVLERIIGSIREASNTLLVLHECGNVIKRSHGGSNTHLLRSLLQQSGVRVIATMSPWEYNELVAGDVALREMSVHVECHEPGPAAILSIAAQHAQRLAGEYQIQIPSDVVGRTVDLSSTFLLHQAHPAKSIRLLELACEDAAYNRIHAGHLQDVLTIDSIARRLSLETGIPEQTILGRDGGTDFKSALTDAVAGQEQAVERVARELQLIKAGLSEPGKPASVLMFAGMTGVGKTELAKRVAELYSGSRRLKVYSMGSFTEPHSVSGIIGVPPGYVGFEEGGRLINELNADPFSVFLLDEAEKCHPNIWKPFLNLFDEGWISDHRGVKAHAERAIFILTTNAGDRAIQQLAESGSHEAEIQEKVRSALSRVRHERSSQPVFPPQFLARIKQIVVFNPLDEAAMRGIAERACRRVATLWRQRRGVELVIEQPVIEWIASKAVTRYCQASGSEGGRIVRKLISELLETAIQDHAILKPDDYKIAGVVRVRLNAVGADTDLTADHRIEVLFEPPGHQYVASA